MEQQRSSQWYHGVVATQLVVERSSMVVASDQHEQHHGRGWWGGIPLAGSQSSSWSLLCHSLCVGASHRPAGGHFQHHMMLEVNYYTLVMLLGDQMTLAIACHLDPMGGYGGGVVSDVVFDNVPWQVPYGITWSTILIPTLCDIVQGIEWQSSSYHVTPLHDHHVMLLITTTP